MRRERQQRSDLPVVREILARAARRLANAVFGGRCFLCRGAVCAAHDEGLLCAACDAELPRLEAPSCPRCALASPHGALCGRCLANAPQFGAAVFKCNGVRSLSAGKGSDPGWRSQIRTICSEMVT